MIEADRITRGDCRVAEKEVQADLKANWDLEPATDFDPLDETAPAPPMPKSVASRASGVADPLNPGDSIGNYLLLKKLGQGAAGTVFLAREETLDREVALKIAKNIGSEARTMASLEHRNIVQVFSESVDSTRDQRLLCMQYVPGTTFQSVMDDLDSVPLAKRNGKSILEVIDDRVVVEARFNADDLRRRDLLASENATAAACNIFAKIAEALAFAHQQHVLHRDIKPSNILIDQFGQPLLADFGVSAREDSAGHVFGGTIMFMAPEHIDAFNPADPTEQTAVDERSDMYSLGVVLFTWLTGKFPFASQGPTRPGNLRELSESRRGMIPELRDKLAGVPTRLGEVVVRTLMPRKEDRFANATELAHALDTCHQLELAEKRMPRTGVFLNFVQRRRYLGSILFTFWPHILGGIACAAYCLATLHEYVSEAQLMWIVSISVTYCVLCFPLLAWFVYVRYRRTFAAAGAVSNGTPVSTEDYHFARMRLLEAPWVSVIMSSIGWLGLLPIATIGSYFVGHGLDFDSDREELFIFARAVIFGWLIATGYSFLILQYVTIRVWYPLLWSVTSPMPADPDTELRSVLLSSRVFLFVASLVPLTAAITVILAGPQAVGFLMFRIIGVSMIVLGVVAFFFCVHLFQLIEQTVEALQRK